MKRFGMHACLLAARIKGGQWLTSFPLSFSALAFSVSGRVCLGSKAAFSTAAAASSLPDLLYSFGSGFSESLCCVSLRANRVGVDEMERLAMGARAVLVRMLRRRVGSSIFGCFLVVVLEVYRGKVVGILKGGCCGGLEVWFLRSNGIDEITWRVRC